MQLVAYIIIHTRVIFNNYSWALSQQAEWAIDSEAMKARVIIVLVKSNQLVKNIETKQLLAG